MTNRLLALAAAAALASCTAPAAGGPALPAPAAGAERAASPSPIQHVVVVIQENRSFDNLFATFPGADGATRGSMHDGKSTPLRAANLVGPDIDHGHFNVVTEEDGGKMDGFDLDPYVDGGRPAGTYPYQYVKPSQIAPYWTIAKQYALADHMFQTQTSGSFTAHQDLIAGSTVLTPDYSVIDYPSAAPWGCDAPPGTVTTLLTSSGRYLAGKGPFPCFTYRTLRDVLDAKGVSWRYYTPPIWVGSQHGFGALWNGFDAIRKVRYGPEWSANFAPETQFFGDVSHGRLAAMSWVIPDAGNSDHLGETSDTGPSWVAQIVNAVGQSKYWNSTAIVVVWDDWGGLYDHVVPPKLDYNGLGFRVPCLIVSPYAKRGYVSHTQYEFASILKFVEETFGLGPIAKNDVRANSIGDAFSLRAPPRRFVPIPAKYSRAFFERQPPSNAPVDTQ